MMRQHPASVVLGRTDFQSVVLFADGQEVRSTGEFDLGEIFQVLLLGQLMYDALFGVFGAINVERTSSPLLFLSTDWKSVLRGIYRRRIVQVQVLLLGQLMYDVLFGVFGAINVERTSSPLLCLSTDWKSVLPGIYRRRIFQVQVLLLGS